MTLDTCEWMGGVKCATIEGSKNGGNLHILPVNRPVEASHSSGSVDCSEL